MLSVETEGIILRTYNLAEADKIVVLLTRDHGLVRGVAKGAKRLKSRFGSGLEPFSVVHVTYRQKDAVELVAIERAEIVTSHFALAGDEEFLEAFSYLTELLTSLTPPHDPNEVLYRMVRSCLDAASASKGSMTSLKFYFELWVLRLAGYMPDWSRCGRCRAEFGVDETVSISGNFHLTCSRCGGRGGDRVIDAVQRELYAAVLKTGPRDFAAAYGVESRRLSELSTILRRMTSQALGREMSVTSRSA